MAASANVYFFYKASVTTEFKGVVWNKESIKEAEISSLAEHLFKKSVNSIVNNMNLTVRVQVFRERKTNPRRRMILKKKVGRVTKSQAQLIVP